MVLQIGPFVQIGICMMTAFLFVLIAGFKTKKGSRNHITIGLLGVVPIVIALGIVFINKETGIVEQDFWFWAHRIGKIPALYYFGLMISSGVAVKRGSNNWLARSHTLLTRKN